MLSVLKKSLKIALVNEMKNNKLTILIFLFFGVQCVNFIQDAIGQNIIWSKKFSKGSINWCQVFVSSNQNIFFCGFFYGPYVIKKYNSRGNEIWTFDLNLGKQYTVVDQSFTVPPTALDKNENIYIVVSKGEYNSYWYLRKYNENRILLWEKQICAPSEGDLKVKSIYINIANDIFLGGDNFVELFDQRAWAARYDSTGNEIWQNTFGYGGGDVIDVNAIHADSQGNLYLIGSYGWTAQNIFFLKFSKDGDFLWEEREGKFYDETYMDIDDQGWRISIDSENNILALGFIDKPWTGSNTTLWLCKFDNYKENEIWSATDFKTKYICPTGLAIDKYNSIYVAGDYYVPTGKFYRKPFIFKYNTQGSIESSFIPNFEAKIFDIDIDTLNNIYFVGDSISYFWFGKYGIPTSVNSDNELSFNELPFSFLLFQNYPNPFNSYTVINYYLPKTSDIKINIYTINGQIVTTLVNEKGHSGYYSINWNGSDSSGKRMASGIYLYQLKTQEFVQSKKMIIVQ